MRHNEEKINNLNKSISKFYYTIAHRDHLHASTITTAVISCLDVDELTVNLRKVVRTGFIFDDLPGEDDLGFIVADNTVLYIKQLPHVELVKATNLNRFQERMIGLNNIAQSGIDLWLEPGKYLSRKVTVRPKMIECHDFKTGDNITLRVEKQDNLTNCTIDLMMNDILIYRQYASKPR